MSWVAANNGRDLMVSRVWAVAIAILLIAAFTTPGILAQPANAPIRIAVIDPLSGSAAEYGAGLRKGQEVAVKMINDRGGLLSGRIVELVFYDDQNIPENGVLLTKRAIAQDGVKFIAGTNGSSVALAIRDITDPAAVIYLVGTAKGPAVTDPKYRYVFRMNSSTTMDSEFFYNYIATVLKPHRVAIIAEQSDYGQGLVNSLKKEWSQPNSPQIVATEVSELTDTDFSVQLTKIKAANPDALFIANGGNAKAAAGTIKQAHQLGLNAKLIIPPGIFSTQLVQLVGKPALEGAINANIYVSGLDNAFNQKFRTIFKETTGAEPTQHNVNGFETIWILAQAIQKAGTDTDTTKIAETIRGGRWDTPRGVVFFDEAGQAHQEGGLVPLVIHNGDVEKVQ